MLYRIHAQLSGELCGEFIAGGDIHVTQLESKARRMLRDNGYGGGKSQNYVITRSLNEMFEGEIMNTFQMGLY